MIAPLELETAPHPTAAVIWLHGLGADGHDFAPIVPQLGIPPSSPLRFVFPHAPSMPVTINGGYVMPAWYDVSHPDLTAEEDEDGIRASQQAIDALIEREEQRGIPASRIVLAGFSQGGAIALHTGLRHTEALAGIIALSTYLPLKMSFRVEAASTNRSCPIFMAHGRMDNVIPLGRGAQSRDFLLDCGYSPEWHEYAMAHSVCDEEIADIGAWLREVLSTES